MTRVLVLRGGALGDFLVTLPLLRALRSRWPHGRIDVVGNARAAELAVVTGIIDAAHSQAQARWAGLYSKEALPGEFRAWLEQFDAIVSFWPDPDRDLARHLPVRAGQQFVHGSATVDTAPAAAHFLRVLPALGLENDVRDEALLAMPIVFHEESDRRFSALFRDGRRPAGYPTPSDALLVSPAPETVSQPPAETSERGKSGSRNEILSEFRYGSDVEERGKNDGPIAVHPGSGSSRKNWPVERWRELVQRLDPHPVLVVLGEAEENLIPVFRALDSRRIQIADRWPLPVLAASLARCEAYIGHDTGVSHLAAATGVRCVLLFGPTDPAVWAPPGEHVTVLKQGATLDGITVAEVIGAWRQS